MATRNDASFDQDLPLFFFVSSWSKLASLRVATISAITLKNAKVQDF